MFIYVKVGMVVFRWRKTLLSMDNSGLTKNEPGTPNFVLKDMPTPPVPQKRYEVTITSQVPHSPDRKQRNLSSPRNTYMETSTPTSPAHARYPSIHETAFPERQTNVVIERPFIKTLDANKATLSYCKTAMLFFFAHLCTWYVYPCSPVLEFSECGFQGAFHDQSSIHTSQTRRF